MLAPVAESLPLEDFPALAAAGVVHGFVGRVPGVEVDAERGVVLTRLEAFHRTARQTRGLADRAFITAEQVHGNRLAVLRRGEPLPPLPCAGADGIITDRADVCLGIYVADCCAIFLVDPVQRAIGLVHSGKKGTDLAITMQAIRTMSREFGTRGEDLIVQLGPCIRPPWYEVDFAADIVAQCRAEGVGQVVDTGACTAADPGRYYSYRREKGRTGRMLALLALR